MCDTGIDLSSIPALAAERLTNQITYITLQVIAVITSYCLNSLVYAILSNVQLMSLCKPALVVSGSAAMFGVIPAVVVKVWGNPSFSGQCLG